MKVCFLIQDRGEVYGAERAMLDLADGLRHHEAVVHVLLIEERRLNLSRSGLQESLRDRGIATGPQAVSMTQVNQRIEIIRADDWRAAPGLDAIEAEVLPAKGGHEVNGHEKKPDA